MDFVLAGGCWPSTWAFAALNNWFYVGEVTPENTEWLLCLDFWAK